MNQREMDIRRAYGSPDSFHQRTSLTVRFQICSILGSKYGKLGKPMNIRMISIQKSWVLCKSANAVTACFLLAAIIFCLPARADLIGRWHFDETSGSAAKDSIADNDGVLSGDAAFAAVGISGNAVGMSRAGNGFVNFGDIFPFTSGDFSYSFWVMMAQGDRQELTVSVGKHVTHSSANGHFVGINAWGSRGQNDKAWFYMSSGIGEELISTTSVNDGEWHHIVVTYESLGQASLYVDGGSPEMSRSTVPTPIMFSSGDFYVGAVNWRGDGPQGQFDGYIDELQIYDHALSAEEVQSLYENPAGNQKDVQINAGLNDAWYNPETDGQGFFITVFPDLNFVSMAWFTYDTELPADDAQANLGDSGHRWLTAVGPIAGNQAVMQIEMTSGGLFDTATLVERTDPPGSDGTIVLTFTSCNSGTVEYDIPSINRSGTVPIQRVAGDNIMLCETLNTV